MSDTREWALTPMFPTATLFFPNLKELRNYMEDQLERKSKIVAKLRIQLTVQSIDGVSVAVAVSEDELLWNQILRYIIHGGWGNEEEPPKAQRLA